MSSRGEPDILPFRCLTLRLSVDYMCFSNAVIAVILDDHCGKTL